MLYPKENKEERILLYAVSDVYFLHQKTKNYKLIQQIDFCC